ncbi:MAG: DUF5317 domain-containing protein [Anaerolineales bacterium]|nr:DUF5317 domain-containing protein [Anaerolineales bacterium]
MILLLAAALGLAAGLLLATLRGQTYQINGLRFPWIPVIALLPQVIALYLPITRSLVSKGFAAACLVGSQMLLLIFVWLNRRWPGILVLAVGLILNLAVIIANGGFMPVNSDTVESVLPTIHANEMFVGERFGTKDVLLPAQDTQLEWLADRNHFPDWFPFQAIYSLGDVAIVLGIFWVLVQPHARTGIFVKELQPS